jgi:cellulose synthase/poly-beta-1,6-N-acetylglucosamine synthase-like glycosyltransferase
MISDGWRSVAELTAWLVAAAWGWRTADAIRYMPDVVDLTALDWDIMPVLLPTLTVVVPARDEEANIASTLDTLMAQQYPYLQVVAVDDRSTDATGVIIDDFAARYPDRLHALHITELPEGWLGKTHALSVATDLTQSDFLLFTDADVLFSPSILKRAIAYAEDSQADHLVVLPTMQVKSRGEGIILGFFQIFGLWASRPWRVADPKTTRDIAGVGAFNLIRREALEEIGGLPPQRLAVLEDITLGRRIKAAGLRQRIAFAPGLVLVHWAKGARGLMRVMTKNLFSAVNFRPVLMLLCILWIMLFCLAPIAGLLWGRTAFQSVLILCAIGATYRVMGQVSLIDARYAWLYPLGALAFIWTMLRSMVTTWWQRGIRWRGTHYALRDLRHHNSPFQWQRGAAEQRHEERKAWPSKLRRLVDKAKSNAKRPKPQPPGTTTSPRHTHPK